MPQLTEEQRTPPKSAQNNAKKAIRWREEYPEDTRGAGTQVGWTRARQLANGGPLSMDTIKRMAQFNRHRSNAEVDPKYKATPWKDKGYLMWLAWGGTSGIDWAIAKSEQYERGKLYDFVDRMTKASPDSLSVGDFVSWNSSGGTARGKIDRIERDGKINVPDSSFEITGTSDDPAALITVYREGDDGYTPTDRKVGHKFSTLTKIKPLKADKSEISEMEKKYMTLGFEMKQMEEDDDYYTFEGYGSTSGNVDLGDDRVMEGAFKETIADYMRSGKMPPVLWQHDMQMPLGVYKEMREDGKGLYVKGRMPKADDFVRGRVMPQMKAGSVSCMSIGYRAVDWDMEGGIRNLKKVDLFEISLVTFPMNPEATVTNVKSIDELTDLSGKTERELERLLKTGVCVSGKAAKTIVSAIKSLHRDDVEESTRDASKIRSALDDLKNIKL